MVAEFTKVEPFCNPSYLSDRSLARRVAGASQVQTLVYTKPERWENFVNSLGFKTPLEFNEGDVGMAGGIQAGKMGAPPPSILRDPMEYDIVSMMSIQDYSRLEYYRYLSLLVDWRHLEAISLRLEAMAGRAAFSQRSP